MSFETKTYLLVSAVMFMEFAVWGAWMPVLAARLLGPLKMTGKQTGWIYGTLPIACIFAPLVAGQIADQWLNAEWIVAGCHLIGAFLLFAAVRATTFGPLFAIMMLYSICFAATLPLVNAILFRHISDSGTQGWVFFWAPAAWALIGYLLTFLRSLRKTEGDGSDCLKLAGVLSLIMVVACFAAPKTEPSAKAKPADAAKAVAADAKAPEAKPAEGKAAEGKAAEGKAAEPKAAEAKSPLVATYEFVVSKPDFMLFLLASLIVSGMMQFYFLGSAQFMIESGISGKAVPAAMGMAQAAQAIATTFALGIVLDKLGFKATLTIGAACWLFLYIVYIAGKPNWLIFVCQIGHGLAYVMFMIVGQVYSNAVAPDSIRSTMQAVIFAATNGLGLFVGTQIAGIAMDKFSVNGKFQWSKVWAVPFAIVAAGTLLLAVGFKASDIPVKKAEPKKAEVKETASVVVPVVKIS